MTVSSLKDLEPLLQPIDPSAPAGTVNLRDLLLPDGSSAFRTLRDQAKAARDVDKQADLSGSHPADWSGVYQLAIDLTVEHVKHLDVVAFLCEASLRIDGFGGVAQSFKLAREMIERFGETLYPLPEADDPSARFSTMSQLNSILPRPLAQRALLPGGAYGQFAQFAYNEAFTPLPTNSNESDAQRAARLAEQESKRQAFAEASAKQSSGYFRTTLSEIHAAQEELKALAAASEKLSGRVGGGVSLPLVAGALEKCELAVRGLAGDRLTQAQTNGEVESASETPSEPSPTSIPAHRETNEPTASGPIRSHSQAIQQLRLVTAYLKQHERHSPLIYLIERALRWDEMPLHSVLEEVFAEGRERKTSFDVAAMPLGVTEATSG